MDIPAVSRIPFLCWFLLLSTILPSNAAQFSNETDRLSLLHFKDLITHDPFQSLSSWNDTLHFCQWRGVTCGRRHPQRVTALGLMSYSLVGRISSHIANLTFLRLINLANNTFHGAIPAETGRLFRLQYLLLANNSLSGEIPVNLTQCSELRDLFLRGNKLVGSIPAELGSLSKLARLSLGNNNLTGAIPPPLGNLSSLYRLYLSYNRLNGNMPADLGQLMSLVWFAMSNNELSGTIPSSIYNISSIQYFDVLGNRLHGNLPPDFGFLRTNLRWFSVQANQITGPIPISLANATELEIVQLGENKFGGSVPNNLGSLQHLRRLLLGVNQLGSGKAQDLSFLASLTNCSNLTVLHIYGNNLGGALPGSIANLSINLQWLSIGNNTIGGSIPSGIGQLVGLTVLSMEQNMLTGTIPTTIGTLNRVVRLSFAKNKLSGEIPASLCNMTQLSLLELYENNLEGSIPSCLENCRQLQFIRLFSNKFGGNLPNLLFGLPNVIILLVQNNSFSGTLPLEVDRSCALQSLDVSNNNLSGKIPTSLGDCLGLETLSLSGNFFQGAIPKNLSSWRGLRSLDLSRNNLSGKIPENLEKISLEYLNLSFNDFEGELPKEGVFRNASAISVLGNSKLCGGIQELHLPACIQKATKKTRISHATKVKVIISVVVPASIAFCFFIFLLWLKNSRKKHSSRPSLEDTFLDVSYAELFQATDGFSSTNLIGTGAYGSVYKGTLHRIGTTVAVKVLNLLQEGAIKSFMAECETLRSIRHRNLVKILTCCSSIDFKGNEFKALIFEYMANESLDKWLHKDAGESGTNLNLIQRLNIAVDVACAFDYLHHHCQVPIVHRDLKPTNILLDSDMVARVGDFGLAKFVSATAHSISVGVRGSVGYIAPEYATGSKASTEGDVYSYGIFVLEMITGKRPTDDMFKDNLTLHHFVKLALPERVMEIAEPQLFLGVEASQSTEARVNFRNKMHDCLLSMARIGLACSAESPRERMEMDEVATQMHAIRSSYVGTKQDRKSRTEAFIR